MPEENKNEAFETIKPKLTPNEAFIESSRCLFCHDAPCVIACPTSIDIPMFIRQIMTKNPKGAAKTIFDQNILGKSCAQVCPTKVLCEGSCVYLNLNEKPIEIGKLQAFASDFAIDNKIYFYEKGKPTGKKVAVIGGGPAGLSCAHELTKLGHDVVVFESNSRPGGLNAYGVAPYKLTNEDTKKEVDYVKHIGFEIKTNTTVGEGKYTIADLEKQFNAIFVATGLGASKKIKIKGEDLKGVVGATEFIYELRDKEQKISVGKKVVVVGAGNTAIDAATESAKLGADVTLVYRRSEKEQKAYSFEVDFAKKNGVKFIYLASPVEIIGKTTVEGLKFVKNELISKGEIKEIKNSDFILPCDMVITAIGQESATSLFNSISKLEIKNGKITVNKDFQTTNPKYFAGGDCVNGGKEVVNAVHHGREAAKGIHKYLCQI